LHDIVQSCEAIAAFLTGVDRHRFLTERLLRSAVERELSIIGEAVGQLLQRHPTVATRISDAARIRSFRNVLIHDYDAVITDVVWRIATVSVPLLRLEAQELLRDANAREGDAQG
jgi:uncharacterized protein with HEPN domain